MRLIARWAPLRFESCRGFLERGEKERLEHLVCSASDAFGCGLLRDAEFSSDFSERDSSRDGEISSIDGQHERIALFGGEPERQRPRLSICVRVYAPHLQPDLVLGTKLVKLREIGVIIESETEEPVLVAIAVRLQDGDVSSAEFLQQALCFFVPFDAIENAVVDVIDRGHRLDQRTLGNEPFEFVEVAIGRPEVGNPSSGRRDDSIEFDLHLRLCRHHRSQHERLGLDCELRDHAHTTRSSRTALIFRSARPV